jgi:hypothetical protein
MDLDYTLRRCDHCATTKSDPRRTFDDSVSAWASRETSVARAEADVCRVRRMSVELDRLPSTEWRKMLMLEWLTSLRYGRFSAQLGPSNIDGEAVLI